MLVKKFLLRFKRIEKKTSLARQKADPPETFHFVALTANNGEKGGAFTKQVLNGLRLEHAS